MRADPIDAAALTRELVRPDSAWHTIDVVEQAGSTNADLAARARSGERPGAVLITDFQSAGRGRQGRVWTAPPGTGIAMSVLVRPALIPPARWTWLPLLTGLAVSDALRQRVALPADLKWPNDVLVGERKLGGILAERVETPSGPAVVLGIGLNVTLGPDQLPVPTATSVAIEVDRLGAIDLVLERTTLITTILVSLERILQQWSLTGSDAAVAIAYTERCSTLGRRVRVELGTSTVEGIADAIDPDGRLIITTPEGPQAFSAGDITHLRTTN